ncbi:MAG TPA: beta-(1-3)-glucosyl transferase, partial [Pseudomonadales bacterium]|nr:beta-(1-3)-glucosyl transferase [Pseudomonadales bacterium]
MLRRNLIANFAVLLCIAAAFAGGWAYFNRPVPVPDWPEHVSGYSFSPFRYGQDPTQGVYPEPAQIRADVELLSGQTNRLRTYSVRDSLGEIPAIAQEYGMNVTLGVWISRDLEANDYEVNRAIEIANHERNIDLVIVGNEAV